MSRSSDVENTTSPATAGLLFGARHYGNGPEPIIHVPITVWQLIERHGIRLSEVAFYLYQAQGFPDQAVRQQPLWDAAIVTVNDLAKIIGLGGRFQVIVHYQWIRDLPLDKSNIVWFDLKEPVPWPTEISSSLSNHGLALLLVALRDQHCLDPAGAGHEDIPQPLG